VGIRALLAKTLHVTLEGEKLQGDSHMKNPKRFKVAYIFFLAPFALAFLSWLYFPVAAQWIITNVLGYAATELFANPLWTGIIWSFYTWYTFVAIGIAGVWITAAVFARRSQVKNKHDFYPMVSFIVPAYNQEKNVARCVTSLFKCAKNYQDNCEIIVVDDGSNDYTYEVAWSAMKLNRHEQPQVRSKVVRHSINLGKIEALKTGINCTLGGLVAIVDADSEWAPKTLVELVSYKLSNGKRAVTGYAHPNSEGAKRKFIVCLQQLEYSQGLSIGRCAQGLGNNVLVVSGAIGIYEADLLREILAERNIRSVTEDLEITLEMHKKGAKVGYMSSVQSSTVVPTGLNALWRQRIRWFTGWLHNTMEIHRDLMTKRSWLTALLWYCYVFEYAGAIIDLAAVAALPFLWWFAPDAALFGLNLLMFVPYGLLLGVVSQVIALRFAYSSCRHNALLLYTPLYPLLWFVNVLARSQSMLSYLKGNNGKWHN
jgi:cellulose synthase/poly-beta-1,6-N-acetylglucosamine synthase-like glycosyltransferase